VTRVRKRETVKKKLREKRKGAGISRVHQNGRNGQNRGNKGGEKKVLKKKVG